MTSVTVTGSQSTLLPDTQPSVMLDPGNYTASLTSNFTFNGSNFPCNQAVLFNTNPLTSNDSVGWYSVIDTGGDISLTITGDGPSKVYVVMLDQSAIWDNNGQVEVVFTKLD